MLGMGWWGEERVISGAIKLQMSDDVLESPPSSPRSRATAADIRASHTPHPTTDPAGSTGYTAKKLHRVSSPPTLPLSSPLCFKLKVITLNVIHTHTVYLKSNPHP